MTKNIVVGLTGNMGAGKSTAVQMIRESVVPVFESDKNVHLLMRDNREMKELFYRKFPECLVHDEIDRSVLSALIKEKKLDVRQLEQMIYPFLKKELQNFFRRHRSEPVIVLDVPLLFESGWDKYCDKIIVVSAPAEVLKQRVFERPGMTEEKYKILTERQMSDDEKRKRADYVIETQYGFEPVRQRLAEIMDELK